MIATAAPADAPPLPMTSLRALSHRPDGLGERLRSLMNAIYLSRVAHCDFGFT